MALSYSREAVKFNRERMTEIQQATRAICEAAAVGDFHTVNILSDKIGILASGTDQDLEQWGKEIKSGDCKETEFGQSYRDAFRKGSTKDRAQMAMGTNPAWRNECVLD